MQEQWYPSSSLTPDLLHAAAPCTLGMRAAPRAQIPATSKWAVSKGGKKNKERGEKGISNASVSKYLS